jgi:hypothetical protein
MWTLSANQLLKFRMSCNMTIMKSRLLAAALLIVSAALAADENVTKTIQDLYTSTLNAMKNAKTKDDIATIVSGMDAPEWVGNLPTGETITRSEAIASLEGLLAIPPEKRPVPTLDFLYVKETGWNILAVYWVYRQAEHQIVGSLVRDTWVRTALGLRRIRHEKFFPDRVLLDDGKPVILPPHNN